MVGLIGPKGVGPIQLKLDRKSGVPLFLQIKNQIVRQVRNKTLTPGDKLPTERELANILGTSRNTVSAAYRLLEQEGYLQSQQGRGTFITNEDGDVEESHLEERLDLLVEKGLEEAWQAGLSTEQFLEIILKRVREREKAKKKIKAVFIECNIEQARVFAKELEDFSHFTVDPLVISALTTKNTHTSSLLRNADFIFTTFSHLGEVRELMSTHRKDIFGLAVKPCLEGLVKIARYPKTTRFAVVSLSPEFHQKFKRNLMSAGLEGISIIDTTSEDAQEVKKVLQNADVIIASPGRCEESKELVNGKKEVIVFNTTLDHGSVKAALTRISDHLLTKEVQ